ncbi:MAG: M48 family metalloprotease [Stenomitos rutilans HA7619-LM2]|jgi:Zn-dependent protease with chaperone function|nr:M48 family metalloprotease [Stenomitos rutilans HA7619-LM2]
MPPVPDSSSTAQHVPDLETGLTALKRGDYKTAIAALESVPLAADHPLAAKAQMGLAVAYARVGEPLRSAALCQALRQSGNRQVSTWATQTLASLMESNPQLADQIQAATPVEPPHVGRLHVKPLHVESVKAAKTPVDSPSPSPEPAVDDLTGFTPFDPAAPPEFVSTDDRAILPDPTALPQHAVSRSTQPITAIQPDVATDEAAILDASHSASSPDETAVLPENIARKMQKPRSSESVGSTAANHIFQGRASQSVLPSSVEEPPLYQAGWRQAGRLPQGKSLGKVKLLRLLLLQAGTAIALFWMVQAIVYSTALYYSIALTKIPFLNLPRQLFHPPVVPILILLGILFVASRWLLDGLLTAAYGLQPLSLGKLATYSPETAQSLQRFCRQQQIPMPVLGVLPAAEPIAFSYGCIPHVTRTVVSQGLLEQLADDEIATIYAGEVGHIACFDVPLLSLVTVLVQIPYIIFRLVSDWGNRKQAAISRVSASILAAIAYGLYALLRWVALWLSRQRVYYSDRVAVELTGNPNGFTRALLKIAIGTTKEVQTQKQTSYLLEGFDLLTPLGQRMATTLGSVYFHTPIESVLEWERTNPYRHWLAVNNSHPPTGDRLNLLSIYARHWKLDTELEWAKEQRVSQSNGRLTGRQWRSLLLQGAPFFGLAFGFATAYLFAALGWVGWKAGNNQLAWMYGDGSLLRGLPLIGFSIGTFIRINPLFPDLPFASNKPTSTSDSLIGLLKPVDRIPVNSQPVLLEGTLLGRIGSSNLLSQDLLLQTPTGIVRLHWLSSWGPIGNLFPQIVRPTDLLHQTVTVTGWFRRGATPWIDVDTIRTAGGRVSRSGHPIWSTILGAIAAAYGIYTIFRGGIF